MTEMTKYEPGVFSWVDLATSDAEGAKKFYGELFGWSFEDMPAGKGMVYTMASLKGKSVAGLYGMGPEMSEHQPHWQSYVSVDNAEESVEKAKSLGGTVVEGPFDVMEAGKMAVIQAPDGAYFSIWQPGVHIGAELVNEVGCFCWNELGTRDPEKATAFYTGLFNWGTQVDDMGTFKYTTYKVGDRMNGGMMEMTPEWGDVPPHWGVYFTVEDCDAAAEKITSLGGVVHRPPADIPGTGRFAVVQDPQGGVFNIITMQNPQ